MKKQVIRLLVAVMVATGMAGCSIKPVEEIKASQGAVETLTQEGAAVYTGEEFQAIQRDLAAAMDEIKVQDAKFIKNYDNATQSLVRVKNSAGQLGLLLASRREEAKQNAASALETAQALVEEARNMLGQAPKGKDVGVDHEAVAADLNGLSDSLQAVTGMIEARDYAEAAGRAGIISQQAEKISAQLKGTMEKFAMAQLAKAKSEKQKLAKLQAAKPRKK